MSVPTWTTSLTTPRLCSPPCKLPPPGVARQGVLPSSTSSFLSPGLPVTVLGRKEVCTWGGPPARHTEPGPSSPFLLAWDGGLPSPCGLKTLTSPKAPQNRSRTSGNVTTSATEAWCRTTLLAVSELGRRGSGFFWREGRRVSLETGRPQQGWEEKLSQYFLLRGLGFWSQLCHGPTLFTSLSLSAPSVSGIGTGDVW